MWHMIKDSYGQKVLIDDWTGRIELSTLPQKTGDCELGGAMELEGDEGLIFRLSDNS